MARKPKSDQPTIAQEIAATKATAEEKALKREQAAAAKAEKQQAAGLAKAAKLAEKGMKQAERDAKAAAKAAELDALKESGRKYVGPMIALAAKVAEGKYTKSTMGQLNCGDELARLLDCVPGHNIVELGRIVLELEVNPYINLNPGQQSMSMRNRLRGALKKNVITVEQLQKVIAAEKLDTGREYAAEKAAKVAQLQAKREEMSAAKEAREAAKAAKAAEKLAA
jgi:hypothetical protein